MIKKVFFAVMVIFLLITPSFAALKINDTAPTFSLQDLFGKDFYLGDVVGAKSKGKSNGVILSFFASWCVPCRHELPLLNFLTPELNKRGIIVVLINEKEDNAIVEALLKELNVTKPIVLVDQYGKTSEKYQLRFLPTTFIVGADGLIKDVIFGEIKGGKELMDSVQKLSQ